MHIQSLMVVLMAVVGQANPPGGQEAASSGEVRIIRNLAYVERALTPHYGADCPVIVAYRITWPDQAIIRGTLSTIAAKVRAAKLTRTALILVGPVLGAEDFRDSALYDAAHEHVLRNRKTGVAARK